MIPLPCTMYIHTAYIVCLCPEHSMNTALYSERQHSHSMESGVYAVWVWAGTSLLSLDWLARCNAVSRSRSVHLHTSTITSAYQYPSRFKHASVPVFDSRVVLVERFSLLENLDFEGTTQTCRVVFWSFEYAFGPPWDRDGWSPPEAAHG